jgi:hypothetical protein
MARSQFDIQAETQFEFSKIIGELQNRIDAKNPQTYEELTQIARDYGPEIKNRMDRLDPEVKFEVCKLFSDASNLIYGKPYDIPCEVLLNNNIPAPSVQSQQSPIIPQEPIDPSQLIIKSQIAKDQLMLGENQTISISVNNPQTNAPETNGEVELRISDSSGKGVHSGNGKTDENGNYSHSWKVDIKSPNSFFTVTVLVDSPSFPNWSKTLYFNRTDDQTRLQMFN